MFHGAKVAEEFSRHFDRRIDINRIGFDPVPALRRLGQAGFALQRRLVSERASEL